MDAIREQLKKPVVVGVAGLIVGILLGILYGWVINPVKWTDAAVIHLRADLQEEFLRMAIDSYSLNGNVAEAKSRFNQLENNADTVLQTIESNPGDISPGVINQFRIAVQAGSAVGLPTQGAPEATPTAGGGLRAFLLPLACILTLLIVAGVVVLFLLRNRGGLGGGSSTIQTITPAMQAQEAARQAEYTDYSSLGEEPPMVQFMASYKIGDDLFDDSFSIDSPSGEFLGECGVGISETIGVGDPKKVTAFEVWLFDKNDIQTVTKVLMSAHSFLDDTIRQRLAAKGEPVLSEAGNESVLETQTLRLVARVVDMGYGDGALPDSSFFDRLILELAVWQK